jgi:hypothetical protein
MWDAARGYRTGPAAEKWFPLGTFTILPNHVFVRDPALPERDLLLADASTGAMWENGPGTISRFLAWRFRRVSQNQPLRIDALEVRWTGSNASEHVTQVRLSGTSVFNNPDAVSGQSIDIPDYNLPGNSNWVSGNNNYIEFDLNLVGRSPLIILVTFFMRGSGGCVADASLDLPENPQPADLPQLRQIQFAEQCRRTIVYRDGFPAQNWGLFTIQSMGEARYPPFTARRTLRAEYRAESGDIGVAPINRIIAWREE